MRIALIGYGKMGQALEALAFERGHEVCTVVRSTENPEGTALDGERLGQAEVALEFTRPEAAPANLIRLARIGLPVVCGTTGWFDRLPAIEPEVAAHGSALLYSPNFSVGVQLFLKAARDLAARFRGRSEYEGYLVEQHHAGKLDAPSGTALALQLELGRVDGDREFPISSIRVGSSPGSHALSYDSPFELIRLEHIARGRQAFAAGALLAAEWLLGKTGLFTFQDMLFQETR
jgi:4-hydroxy-tetrahydrodipicolinate reductase